MKSFLLGIWQLALIGGLTVVLGAVGRLLYELIVIGWNVI